VATTIERLIEEWQGLAVVCDHDRATGTWIFIALHDDTLGSPVGGTRVRVYPAPEDGLRDAMRLAEGMTHKWASIDLDSGGGKGVLALSRPVAEDERRRLLERYARLLDTLSGSFSTGQDLGTTPEDIGVLSGISEHVHGFDAERGVIDDPGPYTALGVLSGIRSAAAHALGADSLDGVKILIQGVGGVGRPLARHCAGAGAELLVSDVNDGQAKGVADDHGAAVVAPEAVYETQCDIYAPCAVGATLNEQSIPLLGCRIVAGAANNQLESDEDAERLRRRGILYAPDYVINAGGALAFGLKARGTTDPAQLRDRVSGLGATLSEIFDEARAHDESPLRAAQRRVERVLARQRS